MSHCIALTKGRELDCSRISGGVRYLYFGVYDQFLTPIETAGIIQATGEVSDINMETSSVIYRYAMPLGAASVSETITGSTENGTIFYTPTVNVVLNKLTAADQNEIKLFGQTKVVIFAQLNETLPNGNNSIIALGVSNGLALNAGSMDTGAAWGDRNGYTLTFDGLEPSPFPFVADYPATGPLTNADFSGFTIDID
tara:strand:- start:1467 stop:2057 length:591 start_codon:yes stop_codon:yes gene_type:complete